MSDKKLQDYAVELANEALRSYEFIDVVEQLEHLTDEECEQVHDLITGEVKAHLPAEPRIIRTVEELEDLGEDAWLMSFTDENFDDVAMIQGGWLHDYGLDYGDIFPLVVLATGDQVRAAREAMKQEHG